MSKHDLNIIHDILLVIQVELKRMNENGQLMVMFDHQSLNDFWITVLFVTEKLLKKQYIYI